MDAKAAHTTPTDLGDLEALLQAAFANTDQSQSEEAAPHVEAKEVPRIFPTVFDFSRAALARLQENAGHVDFAVDEQARVIQLHMFPRIQGAR